MPCDLLHIVGWRSAQNDCVEDRPFDRVEIALRFVKLRKESGLSQKELGAFICCDRKTVNRIEGLRSMPHQRIWAEFCKLESKHNQPKIELPTHWFE